MFRHLPASAALDDVIDGLWTYEAPAHAATEHRVLPDGCIDLIWKNGVLWVAGPDTRARLARSEAGARYAAVRFAPGVGAHVLGACASELRDRVVELSDLWPAARVRAWAERLEQPRLRAETLQGLVPTLQALVQSRVAERGVPERALLELVAALERGASVDAAARATGYHVRTLRRRCLETFGYGPKTLAKILRFQRALGLARRGLPLAAVALSGGYADQSHLCRDVRALAGAPLRMLIDGASR